MLAPDKQVDGGSGCVKFGQNNVGGSGGQGTSYSGGSGGGSVILNSGVDGYAGSSAGANGGSGGTSWYSRTESKYFTYGGVGNPGGTSKITYDTSNSSIRGKNGTGGLLIIYSNSINNAETGKIVANGVENGNWRSGGSSGGGSINIFYNNAANTNINSGNITATGGVSATCTTYGFKNVKAGNGGNGSVTTGNISSGRFIKDE